MTEKEKNNQKHLNELRCPCDKKSKISFNGVECFCNESSCVHAYNREVFRCANGVPVIISKILCDTVCDPDRILSYVKRSSLFRCAESSQRDRGSITSRNCHVFIGETKKIAQNPKVLVIGSGSKGNGTSGLWSESGFELIGIDVYISKSVSVVCDAHYLPFADSTFDGVWIQAVLEHVVDPVRVVSEIHRVLKNEGIVYAETPFLQNVHEGSYDFTRYTVTGHRYLFKKFSLISMGPLGGAEVVLAWAIKYFIWATLRSRTIAKVAGKILLELFKPFRLITSQCSSYDSCSGSYFMGKKAPAIQVTHKGLVGLYQGCIK
jgi:SAM-dependent methyltransferase